MRSGFRRRLRGWNAAAVRRWSAEVQALARDEEPFDAHRASQVVAALVEAVVAAVDAECAGAQAVFVVSVAVADLTEAVVCPPPGGSMNAHIAMRA
jgi:hypothetical protein